MTNPRRPNRSQLPALAAALLAIVLGACSKPAPAPTGAVPPPPPAAPAKPVFGSFGFDTAGMNRSVAPGDDFFEYANGTWHTNTE
ncbi:MAG: M13 family peptidase, partial [Arenimonas sp.]